MQLFHLSLVLVFITFADSVVVTPKTNAELKLALCSTYNSEGHCTDTEFRIIMLTKIFDFTNTEGSTTEVGCYHLSTPVCLKRGQTKLNVNKQCEGLTSVKVTYDKAGVTPLFVGSNKHIVSRGGGLKGKGLKIQSSQNVYVYGLSITDINPRVIWGGDAITLDDSSNVHIHGNYFARIGRQMIVTGHRACKNITISYNEFDGRTPYSAFCDGLHYWLWLFEGADDSITVYNNNVHHTSGRGAHLGGLTNTKVLLHIIKNTFSDVGDSGLVEADSITSRVLIEGNTYSNVTYVVYKNLGRIFYPLNSKYAMLCKQYLGRNCLLNTVTASGGMTFKSDLTVLQEFANYQVNTDQIDRFAETFKKFQKGIK